MSKKKITSVWDALEDSPAAAENMKVRALLMMALKDHIAKHDLTQAQAAKIFGVTQTRVSDLMRGKINLFAIATLDNMAATAGLHVDLRVRKAA